MLFEDNPFLKDDELAKLGSHLVNEKAYGKAITFYTKAIVSKPNVRIRKCCSTHIIEMRVDFHVISFRISCAHFRE